MKELRTMNDRGRYCAMTMKDDVESGNKRRLSILRRHLAIHAASESAIENYPPEEATSHAEVIDKNSGQEDLWRISGMFSDQDSPSHCHDLRYRELLLFDGELVPAGRDRNVKTRGATTGTRNRMEGHINI